ncbi:MAG TPA: PRC-barrel domain-containing protein [Afifellaceae bacterium]|nr:PRC-barrel domain-containing protein [Afifellaceae bacterium]
MFRILMASTALTAMLAAPVAAQDTPKTDTMAADTQRYERVMSVKGATIGQPAVEGYLASTLMGAYIYNSNDAEAEIVGDINDLLVTESGDITAVVVGVGGFLGLGEKDVAIDFDRISLEQNGEDGFRLVAGVDKSELEAAAEFELDRKDMKDMQTELETDAASPDERMAAAAEDPDTESEDPAKTVAMKKPASSEAYTDDPRWTDADRDYVKSAERVDAKSITAEEIIGLSVYGANRTSVGEVGDIVVKDDGATDAVVIDVGGFLGLGEKPVAVSFDSVQFYREKNGGITVMTPFTEEELEGAAVFDEENYKSKRDAVVLTR